MNYGRLLAAAVAALVYDAAYGFLVYGTLLAPQFTRYPAVYRSAETGPAYLPLMFGCLAITILVTAMIYAKGYEGGSGAAEGVRFGVLLGVLVTFLFSGVSYGTLNIGARLALVMGVAGFFEWFGVGLIIGLVYKPSGAPVRTRAAV
jgi:hypothetical protein